MNRTLKHISKSMMAGLVALLPIGGIVYIVMSLESTVAASWLPRQSFYFPGLGIIAVVLMVYVIGLVVSTVVGKLVWRKIDAVLCRMPALGNLYRTLKQVLGSEEEEQAIFKYAVMVTDKDGQGDELGFVTNEIADDAGNPRLMVFVPGVPNPTSGKMLVIEPAMVRRLDMPVNEALKAIISIGKHEAAAGLLKKG